MLGYTQSDEITLVLVDYQSREASAWFDNNIQKMDEMVDVYFYPGCDRLFVMESGEEFNEAKLMPKATSGQIKMLVVAGIALLIGALSVFGISTRRKEE